MAHSALIRDKCVDERNAFYMGSILLKLSVIPLIGLYRIDLVYAGAEGGVFKYRVAVICTKIYESCSFREAYKGVLLFGCGLACLERRDASRKRQGSAQQ